MRKQTPALFAAALLLFLLGAHTAYGQCTAANLTPKEEFEKRGMVIDVRPDVINQFSGKSAFRNEAHVTLINMNPFLFSYKLKVAQTEVQDTGFLNFLNLLGFPVSDLVGSVQNAARSKAAVIQGGNLALLINRTAGPVTLTNPKCPDETGAEEALKELNTIRYEVLDALGLDHVDKATNDIVFKDGLKLHVDALNDRYKEARKEFLSKKGMIFDSNVDAKNLCQATDGLWNGFKAHPYPDADTVDDVKKELRNFQSLVKEMKNSAQEYITEYGECPARASGLGYARNLVRLGDELDSLSTAYGSKLDKLTDESNGYDALKETIAKLNGHENELLQKEYTVLGQYDISDLDITVTLAPLKADAGTQAASFNARGTNPFDGVPVDTSDPRFTVVGDTQDARRSASTQSSASAQGGARIMNVSAPSTAQGIRVFAPHARAEAADKKPDDSGGDKSDDSGGKDIKAKGRIGARRFELSGGIVFSSLDRREFQPVIGFARNEQGQIVGADGNPTDKRDLTKIVGLSQNSSRRFSPMAMMHTRLPGSTKFFFSVGITGKKDDTGTGLEYLLGPSFLFKNMFFTFGGYAGRQQKLAGDLFLGAKLDSDSVPVRNEYKWAPGFSFTYRIPLGGKKETK